MTKIYAVKSNNGWFLTDVKGENVYSRSKIGGLIVNDEYPLDQTWQANWFFSKYEPRTLHSLHSQPSINPRFELKDPEKFPMLKRVYMKEEVYDDFDEYTPEFSPIAGLYQFKSDQQPKVKVPFDFKIEVIAEVDHLEDPGKFKYKVNAFKSDVNFYPFDMALTPPILKHTKPCFLTSEESYKIIREHVKQNINYKVATITSDYDFCFKVSKKISVNPVEIVKEIKKSNGKSYRKPRYNRSLKTTRSVEIFEMTHSGQNNGKGYSGYTVIPGFKGEDREDLQQTIDAYLEDLISFINAPYKDCECCEGKGVIANP